MKKGCTFQGRRSPRETPSLVTGSQTPSSISVLSLMAAATGRDVRAFTSPEIERMDNQFEERMNNYSDVETTEPIREARHIENLKCMYFKKNRS